MLIFIVAAHGLQPISISAAHGLHRSMGFTSRQRRLPVRMLSEADAAKEAQIREQLEGAAARGGRNSKGPQSKQDLTHAPTEAAAKQASFDEAQKIGARLAAMLTESCANGEPMPAEAAGTLRALISTSAGARGWFVTLLTDPRFEPVFRPPLDEALLEAIEASPDPNIRLMTMNVAMSTATELVHLANGNDDLAAASRMTSERSTVLLTALLDRLPGLREAAEALLAAVQPDDDSTAAAAAEDDGSLARDEWLTFCQKWGYGTDQREAIRKKLASVL